MKKNILRYVACAAMTLGLATTLQAATGTLTLSSSGVTQNGGTLFDLGSANSLTLGAWNLVGTTDFSTVNNASVGSLVGTYNIFQPVVGVVSGPPPFFAGSGPAPVQWVAFTGNGGISYVFYVTTEFQTWDPTFRTLSVVGDGYFMNGAVQTVGNYTMSWNVTSGPNASIGLIALINTGARSVPDGGTTLMLLGTALSGLALLRRKLA